MDFLHGDDPNSVSRLEFVLMGLQNLLWNLKYFVWKKLGKQLIQMFVLSSNFRYISLLLKIKMFCAS